MPDALMWRFLRVCCAIYSLRYSIPAPIGAHNRSDELRVIPECFGVLLEQGDVFGADCLSEGIDRLVEFSSREHVPKRGLTRIGILNRPMHLVRNQLKVALTQSVGVRRR